MANRSHNLKIFRTLSNIVNLPYLKVSNREFMPSFSLSAIAVILLSWSCLAQTSAPILRIQSGGHMSRIRETLVTPDKKEIITVSDDKTVKIWSTETGLLLEELNGEIDAGIGGVLYSAAISPDGKYLAVAGLLEIEPNHMTLEDCGSVRMYDYKTRRLVRIIKQTRGTVSSMRFSRDGKYFLVAGDDNKIHVFLVSDFSLYHSFSGHTKRIYEIDVWGTKVVSASYDKSVKLWDLEKKKLQATSEKHNQFVDCIAFSPNGEYIASGSWDEQIIIYDQKLKPIQFIQNNTQPWSLSFSSDSKLLIAGTYNTKGGKDFCNLYEVTSGSKTPLSLAATYYNHEDVVISNAFIDSNTIVTTGGVNEEVSVWRYNKSAKSIEQLHWMKGVGHCKWAVRMHGNKIGFTDKNSGTYGTSKLTNSFDLFSHNIAPIPESEETGYAPILKSLGPYTLKTMKGGEQEYEDGLLVIYKNKIPVSRIRMNNSNGNRVRCFTFTQDTLIAVGGDNGNLFLYDINGSVQYSMYGHTGRLWGLAVSADGKRLVSCGDDQMIKLWDLASFNDSINPSFVKKIPFKETDMEILRKNYQDLNLSSPTETDIKKLYQYLLRDYGFQTARYLTKGSNTTQEPLVSLFITENLQDWILWCEDGYFCSSREGSKFIGYHINMGIENNARFFPFEQFDLKFNRPDIINNRLLVGDAQLNQSLYKAYQKRLRKMGVDEASLSSEIHLPNVSLNNHSSETSSPAYTIYVNGSDSKYKLDKLQIWINHVPLYGVKGMSLKNDQRKELKMELPIQLSEGKNLIQISVMNDKGAESLKEQIQVFYKPISPSKSTLHLITIGASQYKNKEMNLKYASKDADDLQAYFSSNKLEFEKIISYSLTNEEVTRDAILKLKEQLKKSTVNDVIMIFVSGHGLLDENLDYYLATYDVDFRKPASNGIAYDDFEQILDSIPARRKVLFLDACHSGEVDKEDMVLAKTSSVETGDIQFRSFPGSGVKRIGLENSFEMMKQLFSDLRKGNGTTVISSAGGAEYALEGDEWKNGVFTYCLLSGLKENKADLNKDGTIMLSEIQNYLMLQVTDMTKGKQRPTSRLENKLNDWKVK
jgi:WD40 repeat protein